MAKRATASGVRGSSTVAAAVPAEARRSWASLTTPDRFRAILIVLVVGLMLAGTVTVWTVWTVDDRTRDIEQRLGPVSTGTLTLYRALADGDAALVSEVLAQRVGGAQLSRSTFDDAVAVAGRNVAATGARTSNDTVTADRLGDVAADLPVYSGLAERARAASGPGQPDALRQATDLMRSTILPTEELVQTRQSEQLDNAYAAASGVPLVGILLGAGVVFGLLAAQVFLWRRTRRVFTVGMVLATVAVATAGTWWAVAGTAAARHLDASRGHLEMVTDALGPAQVAAAQARAAEGLTLVNGDDETDDEFRSRILVLARDDGAGGALGAARALAPDEVSAANVTAAAADVREYVAAHDRARALVAAGRPDAAARSIVLASPGSSASAFTALDTALAAGVDRETEAFRTEIASTESWRTGLMATLLVLGTLAVAGVGWGLGHRLGEYR